MFRNYYRRMLCATNFDNGANHYETVAVILVIGVVISMTRAFALTNLFEVLLWTLFLVNKNLRVLFINSLRDLRIAMVMFFWLWVTLSALWGSAPIFDRLEDVWSWRKLVLVPIVFALFTSEARKHLLGFSLIGVSSIYMLFSWLGYMGVVELDRSPSQLLENHSTQGVLFSATGVLCWFYGRESNSLFLRSILGFILVGCISNVFVVLTGRSGYLFLIVVMASCAYMQTPSKRFVSAGLVCLVIMIALSLFQNPRERVIQAFDEVSESQSPDTELTSLGVRVVMWTNTIQLISDKPVLGSGAGSFPNDYSKLVVNDNSWRGAVVDDPHQQYLHIAAEYGLVGLMIFLASLILILMTKRPTASVNILLAKAFLLGTMANGFANGHFSAFVEGRFVWIFVGAFLAGTEGVRLNTFMNSFRTRM